MPAAPPAVPQGFSPQTTGPIQPQISGQGPIRVPPLVPAKASEYAGLFEKSGAVNGVLSGMNVPLRTLHHQLTTLQARMQRRSSRRRDCPTKSSVASGTSRTRSSAEH